MALHAQRLGAAVLLSVVLAACTPPGERESEVTAQYRSIPTERAWIRVPPASLVTERRAPGLHEQRVLLPNLSDVAGENTIYMRAVIPPVPGGTVPPINLQGLLDDAGGMPFPFTQAALQTLRSAEDAVGSVTWTLQTDGAGTFCVLAMRRLPGTGRIVPTGSTAIDLLMRNCVDGLEAEALAPIRADRVGFASSANMVDDEAPRSLSPLAAPLP